MKSVFKMSLLALSVATLAACNHEAAPAKVELTTEAQKQAYAMGAANGLYAHAQNGELTGLGLSFDSEVVAQGFKDGLKGEENLSLSQEEIQTILKALGESIQQKRQAQAQEAEAAAKMEGAQYLEENKKKDGVIVTDSGLQYEVLVAAEGDKPSAEDKVKVRYHGTLIDGTVFDSSHGETITFALNGVIPGWTEGVQLMSVGSKFRFTIPSELAYGAHVVGAIPPYSTLIFEVELFSIEKAKKAD
ncbi:FKBP-type peptidyl-prolyl cis-trans isomerase [Paraferrimonas sp. SM1919]|uniref:FKBP-type peptidyl-prolyl cis-trans isomerase n=1 Tax=Paraferrimonas sp. SM1919 TaxID=2662263 RepID=UPI0013CFF3CA|nr:FKBP-type peptidyl-prolyl cis-trans isomerase [Paraferrimonas sp. SM1919]